MSCRVMSRYGMSFRACCCGMEQRQPYTSGKGSRGPGKEVLRTLFEGKCKRAPAIITTDQPQGLASASAFLASESTLTEMKEKNGKNRWQPAPAPGPNQGQGWQETSQRLDWQPAPAPGLIHAWAAPKVRVRLRRQHFFVVLV